MCEYCKNREEDSVISRSKQDKWFIRKVKGVWYLFYRNFRLPGSNGIEISNCPFCGRKLNTD